MWRTAHGDVGAGDSLAMLGMLSLIACVRWNIQDEDVGSTSTGKIEKTSTWAPGDVIPGWEAYDFDCAIESTSDSAVVTLPDLWRGAFLLGQLTRGLYIGWEFSLADCTDFACEGISSLPMNAPNVTGTIEDNDAADLWRKTGYYGAGTDRGDSSAHAAFYLPTGGFTTTDDNGSHEVTACLSRVRPDQLTGVVYVSYWSNNLYHDYYDHAEVQYPFDIAFADHAAWDYTLVAAARRAAPDDRTAPYIAYATDASYDIAWDWDAITDPDIRAAVYDRYTPENWP